MERMEGVDAGYLYMETPSMHMHTLKVAILDPGGRFDFATFTRELMDRLDRMPPLQRRVVPAPLALNHPLWVHDHEIDPSRHVFRHRLPEGAGMRELEALIGEVASTPLDRSVPLWEVHVAEGLGDGQVGIIGKLHHAIADGGASNALIGNVSDQYGPSEVPPSPEVEPLPGRVAQLRTALTDAIAQLWTLPALVLRTVRALVGVVRLKRSSDVRTPVPVLDAPRTPFNAALTPRRSFATTTVPLDDLKQVSRAHGVSLNDVVLTVVSGALRAWLQRHGGLPRGSLVAGVPVGTDTGEGPRRLHGNRVSNLFTTLATHVEDPVARLLLVSQVTRESKKVQHVLGLDMMRDWVEFTPPAPFSALLDLYSRRRTASKHRPPFNVIVSNVRGPSQDVTFSGVRLSDLFSVGPLIEGIGLNVTAWSYRGRLNFSLLSCPELVPDLRELAADLAPALEELVTATVGQQATGEAPPGGNSRARSEGS
jgi:diacylglycerol O-acyltransferase / wax synthase